MKLYVGACFSEVYRSILEDLVTNPVDHPSPRGMKTKEVLNAFVQIANPMSNTFINKVRSTPKKYLAGELIWYFSGNNDVEYISKYSKMWNTISNFDETVNSAYGYLVFRERNRHGTTEYEWAHNRLSNDSDSRQAILRFNKPDNSYYGNSDFVCTLNAVFMIRKNELNLTVTQRSVDAMTGITFDFPFFTLLQQQMLIHLRVKYPALQLGTTSVLMNSLHLYEKHFDRARSMLEHSFEPDGLPPLSQPLIESNGTPSREIESLYHRRSFETNDQFLLWLLQHS